MTITQAPSAPLFVVIGSTGTQGGSVIRALKASSSPYRVRAITRDASKPAAKELSNGLGCQVFEADLDSGENNLKLGEAFEGAHYVFAMTAGDYAAKEMRTKEYAQGKAQMDAAHAAQVKIVIWAGLTNMNEITGGKIKVDIFDLKAELSVYARSLKSFQLIDVRPGGYSSNALYFPIFQPKKGQDGSYMLAMALDADSPYPQIDMASDYGRFVVGAVEKSKAGGPEIVYAGGHYTTPAEMVDEMTRVSGKKVTFYRVPDKDLYEGLSAFNMNMANNLAPMMQAIQAVGYYGGKDLAESNKLLSSPPVTFGEFLDANKETFLKLFE